MVIICSYWSSPDVWVQVSEWAAAQSSSWLQGKRPSQRKQQITELTWRKGKLTAARIRLFPHYRSLAVEELSYPTRRSTTKEGNSGKKSKDTWAKTRQLTPEPCWGGVPEMTCACDYTAANFLGQVTCLFASKGKSTALCTKFSQGAVFLPGCSSYCPAFPQGLNSFSLLLRPSGNEIVGIHRMISLLTVLCARVSESKLFSDYYNFLDYYSLHCRA